MSRLTFNDHCLDHFESLEFAQAQLREKSHFTSLFSSQSAVFALCQTERRKLIASASMGDKHVCFSAENFHNHDK